MVAQGTASTELQECFASYTCVHLAGPRAPLIFRANLQAMEHVDTLITARWVIPIEPSGVVLERHAIAIRQGRIVAIEPEQEALLRFTARERIDRPQHVLIPGLVNAHTHAAMTLL